MPLNKKQCAQRAEEARLRQEKYESCTPRQHLRMLRDRDITSGREFDRLVKLLTSGQGDIPIATIRKTERRKARQRAKKVATDAAIARHVLHP